MNDTFLPKIKVISDEVDPPPLGRERRIAVLLPHDYDETRKRYPVLYLQDGQNLFEYRSPFGNWHVDKRLAELSAEGMGDLIVVAIDHADGLTGSVGFIMDKFSGRNSRMIAAQWP